MSDQYRRLRDSYGDSSGVLVVAAATDDTTLLTPKTNYTFYLQKLHVQIADDAMGVTWQVEGSTGPVDISGPIPASASPFHVDYDFGPRGRAVTGNLLLNVSAAGAAGTVTWEGYQRLNTPIAASSAT